ncbi:trypsin-like serine protease [Vibrio parahaemolyticus]|uniref:trypsin-like serine protease n=1 Tax=Vibrio parahaemolyticus TaxID=670 RepID=UPI00111D1B32|nr:trypsin-like serine protease [Vibrio parahaemolyticus]TOJ64934.1 GlyGly-CTERM sorting domain-containing protein [Vibrio parahaemolyticus]TOK03286.1 GlyGly-CTERM sorting domain-containing protein [Vibrio parahaemolyticus]
MRLPSLSLIALSLLSASSYAVENGTPVDWSQQDNVVRLDNPVSGYCSATLLAGRYAITAAHCLDDNGLDRITTASNEKHLFSNQWLHPNYFEDDGFSSEDVGIVVTDTQIDYRNIQFLNVDKHTEGDPITITGFGGTVESLNKADFTFSHYHWANDFSIYADVINDSHTTDGDSGAAWTNANGGIIAIHKGSDTTVNWDAEGNETRTRETYGTDIQAVQNFITKTIDGWHYPTLVDTDANGKATITIQSLHQTETSGFAYTDGENTTLINEESTCFTKGQIQPFEKCTYVIESNGEEGELYLTDNEVIHINKPIENTGGGDGGNNNADNDDSGGSMGFWPLLLLGIATLRRKR